MSNQKNNTEDAAYVPGPIDLEAEYADQPSETVLVPWRVDAAGRQWFKRVPRSTQQEGKK